MPRLRPYVDADWEAVLDLCLRRSRPACESLERLRRPVAAHADLDWRTSIGRYLRSLTRSGERGRLRRRRAAGLGGRRRPVRGRRETQSGSIGVSAVHPARQGKGIGTLMYDHVLDAMRAQGVKYATADTGGDASHAPARRVYEKARIRRRADGSLLQALGDSRAGRRRPGTPSGGERTPLRSTRSVSKLLRDPRRPQTAMSPGRVVGSGNSGLPGGVASPARSGGCQSALTRSSECSSASTTTTAGRHARGQQGLGRATAHQRAPMCSSCQPWRSACSAADVTRPAPHADYEKPSEPNSRTYQQVTC